MKIRAAHACRSHPAIINAAVPFVQINMKSGTCLLFVAKYLYVMKRGSNGSDVSTELLLCGIFTSFRDMIVRALMF